MSLPEIDVVAAIIHNSKDQLLITLRPKGFHLSGLWEFPGGKVEYGESKEAALVREIKEETNLEIMVGELFWRETVDYSKKRVHLFFYDCRLRVDEQRVVCHEIDDFHWVSPGELNNFEFPEADRKLIDHLVAAK
jgi:8-oxo-dGTP diphosphatase